MTGLSNVAALVGFFQHFCALLSNGRVECWGSNALNQITAGSSTAISTPMDIGASNVQQVAVGYSFTCVLLTNGTVSCQGDNEYSQLGYANCVTPITSLTPFPGLSGVTSISAGDVHWCAILTDQSVHCFGVEQQRRAWKTTTQARE